MKKFFNIFTVIMSAVFVLGLVVTAVMSNWLAFGWVIVGLFAMIVVRIKRVREKQLLEDKVAEITAERDDYMTQYKSYLNKYNYKLKENYDLTDENLRLTKEIQRLGRTASELGGKAPAQETAVDQEPVVHGNIKIKRKKRSSPKVKSDIQDKTE